jgi:hypothetical protein
MKQNAPATQFRLNWRVLWLRPTQNLDQSTWTAPPPLVITDQSFDSDDAWVFINASGANVGDTFVLTNTVSTPDGDGDIGTITITIEPDTPS